MGRTVVHRIATPVGPQDGCTVLLAPEEVSCESFCEVPRWHREAARIQVARDDGPFPHMRSV